MARTISQIIRRKNGGPVGLEKWSMLGHRFVKVPDPEGENIPSGWMDACILDKDFPKIPGDVWSAVASLYIHFMEDDETRELVANQKKADTGLEVAVFFTKNLETGEVEAWVPTQEISAGSVDIDYDEPITNLVTGELVKDGVNGLPDEVVKIGTSHSHNTMWAGFSSIDDANELGQPGLHIVAGRFKKKKGDELPWKYEIAPSVVMGGKRYEKLLVPDDQNEGQLYCRSMAFRDIIAYDEGNDTHYHDDVLKLIKMELSSFRSVYSYSGSGYGQGNHYYSSYNGGGMNVVFGGSWDERWWWDREEGVWVYIGPDFHDPDDKRHLTLVGDDVADQLPFSNGGFGTCTNCGMKNEVSRLNGHCFKCDWYHPDMDDRSQDTKTKEEKAEPVYDEDGYLKGYRSQVGTSKNSLVYCYISLDVERLALRHNWSPTGAKLHNASAATIKRSKGEKEVKGTTIKTSKMLPHSKSDWGRASKTIREVLNDCDVEDKDLIGKVWTFGFLMDDMGRLSGDKRREFMKALHMLAFRLNKCAFMSPMQYGTVQKMAARGIDKNLLNIDPAISSDEEEE